MWFSGNPKVVAEELSVRDDLFCGNSFPKRFRSKSKGISSIGPTVAEISFFDPRGSPRRRATECPPAAATCGFSSCAFFQKCGFRETQKLSPKNCPFEMIFCAGIRFPNVSDPNQKELLKSDRRSCATRKSGPLRQGGARGGGHFFQNGHSGTAPIPGENRPREMTRRSNSVRLAAIFSILKSACDGVGASRTSERRKSGPPILGRFWPILGCFFSPPRPPFRQQVPAKSRSGARICAGCPIRGASNPTKKKSHAELRPSSPTRRFGRAGAQNPDPQTPPHPGTESLGLGGLGGVFSDQKSGPNVEISTITQPHHMPFFATDAQRRPQSGSKIGFHFGADDAPRSAIRRKNGRARENRRTGGADFGNVVRAESRRAIRDTKCRGGEWGGQLSKSPLGIRIGAVVRELSANW